MFNLSFVTNVGILKKIEDPNKICIIFEKKIFRIKRLPDPSSTPFSLSESKKESTEALGPVFLG